MRRFSLRTLLIALTVLALATGYYREQIATWLGMDNPEWPLVVIDSKAEMEQVLSARHSIIFIDAAWSSYPQMAKKRVRQLAVEWQRNGRMPFVQFYILDLTENPQNRPTFVNRWLHSDDALARLDGLGSGEVVCLANGELRGWFSAYNKTVEQLKEETVAIFAD